tara:strand:+ start:662 stop:940 length:279 start_codon:yes stop_codon:yes gene_type:complete
MFKIGEKVVYVGKQRESKFAGIKRPKVNEIVTIHSFCKVYGGYDISEYLRDNNGMPQSFMGDNFRKLDYEFADSIIREITKDISEKRLVSLN